ncbi:MAG TPA: hypothetical protein VIZ28_06390 [Chitinophagaceae bacterium]
MNTHLILSFLILLLLGSCVLNDKNTQPTDKTDNSNETQYAFITDILQNGDSVYLNADYVQYLTGDSAIAAAISEGQADTVQIDGKMHVDVPNDYYILNNNPKLRKLRIDKKCEFDFLLALDRVDIKNVDNSLSSLKKIYKDAPFILTLNKDETIVRIEEVFIP